MTNPSRRGWLNLRGTHVRPWAIAEDQVKVAASAGHVEVAFSLSKWPLAQVLPGAGAVALPAVVEVRIGPATAEEQHRQLRSSWCAGATPAASTGLDDAATGFAVKGRPAWLYRRLTTAVVDDRGRHLPRRDVVVDENGRHPHRHPATECYWLPPAPVPSALSPSAGRAADGASPVTTELLSKAVDIRRGQRLPNCRTYAALRHRQSQPASAHTPSTLIPSSASRPSTRTRISSRIGRAASTPWRGLGPRPQQGAWEVYVVKADADQLGKSPVTGGDVCCTSPTTETATTASACGS